MGEKNDDERDSRAVRLNDAQYNALKGGINAVRGAVNRTAEAVGPVQDKESVSVKLGTIIELLRNSQPVDLTPVVTALIGESADDERSLSNNIGKWLGLIVEAIKQQPGPPSDSLTAVEAKIVARYKFNEDQEPVEYPIVVTDFKSAKGTAVGGDDIDVTIESSSAQLSATFTSGPTLSEDKKQIDATVRLEGQDMTVNELAVVAIRATNRDTGSEVAADTDEFETGPGEAAIGRIETPVPLDEVPEG